MTKAAMEISLDEAIAEGRRALGSRDLRFVNVLVNRDALRVLVANTEVVRDAVIRTLDPNDEP